MGHVCCDAQQPYAAVVLGFVFSSRSFSCPRPEPCNEQNYNALDLGLCSLGGPLARYLPPGGGSALKDIAVGLSTEGVGYIGMRSRR